MTDEALEQLAIDVIRGLAMDAPQAARNGHPGTAMALAPLAHVLFTRVMRHDPAAPDWPDRDRFVLSAGHASILLYSMLYLTGYGLTLDDIRAFRTWGSRTPGHPEVHHTKGVETTTGPLGQGFANAVGMGIAERWLRSRFGPDLCDHHTFVVCSDGDLEEGISHEAASLAGHLGLGRLVYVYDDNHISIDGPTELSLSDDAVGRFEAYGWHVDDIGEVANDCDALEGALRRAKEVEDRPSLIVLRSHIGWPAPNKTDTASAHGEPLGDEEIRATKEILGLPVDETFHVPAEVIELYRDLCAERGRTHRQEWEGRLAAFAGDRTEWDACMAGRGVSGWDTKLPVWEAGAKVATRNASRDCLNAVADVVPGLLSGGADLTGNTGTLLKDHGVQSAAEPEGRLLHYGIREHAMGAVMNGMALHGGVLPVGGTFFVFSDYMRPAVRLAAMSGAHVVYSWSHDSVGLGQDGPTHQPIEHLAALRAIPGLRLIRPADANEVAHAWRIAVDGDGPTALVLTRQDLAVLEGTAGQADGVARGAYVLVDTDGLPEVVLLGTGSEVGVCVAAAQLLAADGVRARVVSMPSWDLFAAQDGGYRASVLPTGVPVLAVEAASPFGWERWADATVTIDRFGASAPGDVALEQFGFTPGNVAGAARSLLTTTKAAP
ncbi:MAG TPA: transketolase [Acidimicrobiales bacterium]|nr:transketolase [Acidimicrobiales bacterium]